MLPQIYFTLPQLSRLRKSQERRGFADLTRDRIFHAGNSSSIAARCRASIPRRSLRAVVTASAWPAIVLHGEDVDAGLEQPG